MSKRRREWKESLKLDAEDQTLCHDRRGKIKILKDETFRNVEGELILVSNVKNTLEDDNSMLQMTPHHPLSQKFSTSIEKLTPTFRKPEIFLAETKEVMKSITPVKLFPVPSEPQLKETFTIIPPYYYTEKNEEFHNLNNIESILGEHNNEVSCFVENFSPEEEPVNTNSCSFTVQVEVEHHIDQEHNDDVLESLSVLNDETVATVDQNSVSKTTTDEIEIFEGINEESKNITDNNNNGVVVVAANNSTNSCSEQFLNIIVTPEMHNEPKMKNHDDSEKYEKVLKHNHIIDENKIVIEQEIITETEDKTEEEETLIETEEEATLDAASETTKKLKKKRPKRNIHYNKSYLDYMSEEELLFNEAFPSEASSADYTEESSDLSHNEDEDKKGEKNKKSKKKLKKAVKIKRNNKTKDDHNISAKRKPTKSVLRQEAKKKKEMGESYKNDKGELVGGKSVKPNPCKDIKCGNGCGDIPEEKSQRLFSYFWGLNSNQRRKDWIAQCAVKKSVKRPNKESTRSCTYEYFINEDEGRRKVCQKYLIKTLDVTQRFILYTLDTMTDGYAKTDERGKTGGYNKTKEEVIEHASSFIESLPTMPSHYCRKDSKRLYFPEEFKNKSNLYHIYKNNCKQSEIKPMSYQVFNTWFIKTFNIGFHVPKKDKCTICSNKNNEEKTEEKEKIERHVKEKEESYKRFKYHQNLHGKDKSIICASFDMQKVLNTPHGDSMMLYYSRKFAVYNLTIYESSTRRGFCNVWTEADAHRGANEISTCLYKYIIDLDSCGTIKTVLLYCDSCYGQNKNKTTLSMIRYAVSQCKTIKTVQINYLIPGHTYMPVDSVHATIENKIKKSIIWAPSQWPTIMEFARQEPQPYKVNVLKGKDFIGFDNVVDATFKKSQKISISKLNIATFKKQEPNVIYIKNSMLPDAETTEIRVLPLKTSSILKEILYPAQLGISAKKHKDLMNLVSKNIIPSRFAVEYKDLKISTKVKDTLMDTDEEDVTEITGND